MIPRSMHLFPLAMAALYSNLVYSQTAKPQPTSIAGAESSLYKTVGDTKLRLHIFPPQHDAGELRPAIVFFFGGGWQAGSVNQFVPQSKYLAQRGMVAIVADYRVKSRHGVTAFECVADAISTIRWVRTHADDLKIDGDRIVAAGGSAGGHLAVCTALLTEFDKSDKVAGVSSVPNALVLFNPALDLTDLREHMGIDNAVARFGEWIKQAERISPMQHVKTGAPPTIIFHGTDDRLVPFEQASRFCQAMKELGNHCEVVPFEGRSHGFFNYGRGQNDDFKTTLRKTDEFLISLKYLNGEPTIK